MTEDRNLEVPNGLIASWLDRIRDLMLAVDDQTDEEVESAGNAQVDEYVEMLPVLDDDLLLAVTEGWGIVHAFVYSHYHQSFDEAKRRGLDPGEEDIFHE